MGGALDAALGLGGGLDLDAVLGGGADLGAQLSAALSGALGAGGTVGATWVAHSVDCSGEHSTSKVVSAQTSRQLWAEARICRRPSRVFSVRHSASMPGSRAVSAALSTQRWAQADLPESTSVVHSVWAVKQAWQPVSLRLSTPPSQVQAAWVLSVPWART